MEAPYHLITIKFSHYNEKARWALDRFRVPYRESAYLPILHFPFALWASRALNRTDAVSSMASTPILVTPHGTLCDSSEILAYVSGHFGTAETTLFPSAEARALERRFSVRLGRETRRLGYGNALNDRELSEKLADINVGGWQAAAYKQFYPVFQKGLFMRLRVSDETLERAIGLIQIELDYVRDLLADGRRYLADGRFSAADLTFATLTAPVLLMEQSEGYFARLPYRSEMPAFVADIAERFRGHPAGRFALRIFREERSRRVAEEPKAQEPKAQDAENPSD